MQPRIKLVDNELAARIAAEARAVLSVLGVEVDEPEAVDLLLAAGASRGGDPGRVLIPEELVERSLATAPASFALFDADGRQTHSLGGGRVHFQPASSAITLLDPASGRSRPQTTEDYVRYAAVVAGLPDMDAQSTAFVPADVAAGAADSYRLYLSLLHCPKPVVTGVFGATAFAPMLAMLAAVRGGEQALAERPLAVFTCCPTSPLKWSAEGSRTLMDCARAGVPAELVPVPLSGFIAPVTLVGTMIQAAAENLAGLVIHQLARAGAPLLWGSCSAVFDIRYETAPLGAVESMMLGCGSAAVGSFLGLPTQAYIALSDAKAVDAQAGIETSMGATLAVLAGIDTVSGPGMLDFINCFSIDKLVVDHEVCSMAQRLAAGITPREDFPSLPHFEELLRDRHLLIADHTRRHLREEISFPGPILDRAGRARWREEGRKTLAERAASEIERLVSAHTPPSHDQSVRRELAAIMEHEAARHGMDRLPAGARQ